jgi:hypothetical protein
MEFNGARMKQPRDFAGEATRMHDDEMSDAARRDHIAAQVTQRRWWQFWRRSAKA